MSPAGMYWGPTLWLRSFCTEVLAGTWKSGQQFIHLLMDKKPFQPQCIFSELFPPMHFMSNCIFSEMKSQERETAMPSPLVLYSVFELPGGWGLNPPTSPCRPPYLWSKFDPGGSSFNLWSKFAYVLLKLVCCLIHTFF